MSVTVVMAADQNFVAPLAATIRSILDHVDQRRDYELVVLDGGICEADRARLRSMTNGYKASVRFVDMKGFALSDAYTGGREITNATYYRLLISELVDAPKCVYTDVDVVYTTDIAKMYDTDITGFVAGVCHEADGYVMYRQGIGDVREYWDENRFDPSTFFYSGGMVMDLDLMRALGLSKTMADTAMSRDWERHDLDVLNVCLRGMVKFVDQRWVVMRSEFECAELVGDPIYDAYLRSVADPWQVHFGGDRKPWAFPGIWKGALFWDAVLRTPFAHEAVMLGQACRV